VPLLDPLEPDVMLTQVAPKEADHEQPEVVETVTEPVPADGPNDCEVGLMV
jgi:hypothetical protein